MTTGVLMTTRDVRPVRKRRAYAARVPAAERRTQLLDAALTLVATLGHQAVTMDAVADRAGVTKPVIYGQFTGRAELLAALLRREQELALGQLRAMFPADAAPVEPPALFARLFMEFLETVRRAPDRWRCIVFPLPDMPAEFHAARDRARELVLGRVEELIRRTPAADRAGADPELAAHTVVTLFEMAARLMLTDPARFGPDRFLAAMNAGLTGLSGR